MSIKILQSILNNKVYYGVLLIEIIFCTVINYKAEAMGPMVVLYKDFTAFFLSGFDLNLIFHYGYYTFPMWGYGVIFLLFNSKLLIIISQQLLTFITIKYINDLVVKNNININIIIFRWLSLFSVNWFVFHTSVWPYSISANLVTIAIVQIFIFYKNKKISLLLLSGFLFGIALNLRSDYYYYTIFVSILILISSINLSFKLRIFYVSVWLFTIHFLLLPWGVYTYKRTGSYLQTSTNAGHVFFISLGQLPNNKWHITPEDNDSVMYSYLYKHFGIFAKSLSYKEDIFLKRKWFELVKNDPSEYAHKCIFNIYRIFTNPFYQGNVEKSFYNKKQYEDKKHTIKTNLQSFNYLNLFLFVFSQTNYFFIIPVMINFIGATIFLIFCILVIINFKFLFFHFRNDPFLLFLGSIIFYQLSMLVFAFYLPIYHTNVFLFYVLMIAYFLNTPKMKQLIKEHIRPRR